MRKLIQIAAAVLGLLAASHAHAEVVTTVLAAIGGWVGGGAAAGALIVSTAFSLVSSAYASRQQRKAARRAQERQNQQDAANLADRTATIIQSDAPWPVIYGAPPQVGCTPVAQLSSGLAGEFKHLVVIFAAHPCEGIDEIYIDGQPLKLDADGWTTNTDFLLEPQYAGDVSAGPAVHVSMHLSPGGVDTADAFLIGSMNLTYPGQTLWTAAHKLTGFTYAVVTLNQFFERFQGGMPQITAKIRGKKVLDVRTGQTQYSRNPALILADFLMSRAGYGAQLAQIDQAALISAANACDQQVYGPEAVTDVENYGGSRALYVCDGMFRTDQDRDSTRQSIEDCMAGVSLESAGVWRIQAGSWASPVMALTDDDMLASVSVTQAANSSALRFNGARGTYVNAARGGNPEDFKPYFNPTFLALDGKEKVADIPLTFTTSHVRCQQLARVRVERSRGGFTVRFSPKMRAWKLQPGDRITLSSGLYGFTNKTFRITDWSYAAEAPLTLLAEEDEASFYDLADEVKADPSPNTNLPNPFAAVEPPQNLDVVSEEIQQSGTLVYRARAFWDQSTEAQVLLGGSVRVEWRRNLPEEPWQTRELPGDATETFFSSLEVGAEYEVRVRFQSRWAVSSFARIYYVFTGKSRAPEDVAELTLTVEVDGIYARWASPAGLDLLDWSVSEVRVGPTWEAGVQLWRGKATVANLGWLEAGERAIWVVHRDREGRESVPQFEIIEILPPAQPLPEASVANRNTIHLAWQDCKTTQPLRHYELRYGPVFADAELIGLSGSTTYSSQQLNFGIHRYWVTGVDLAGNRGPSGYADAATLESLDSLIGNYRALLDSLYDDLAAQIIDNTKNTDDQANRVLAGAIEKVEIVKEANKATAKRVTGLVAQVNQNKALATEQIELIVTEQGAQATKIEVLAVMTDENHAAIIQEQTARVDGDSALAQSIETVQSDVGDLSATVQTQANTLADLNGNVAAQYMIRAEAIGVTGKRAFAGLSINVSAESPGTPAQSEVIVLANSFLVAPDTSSLGDAPFKVEGGVVYINVAKIKDADIGTLKIAGRAVTQPAYAETEVSTPLASSGLLNSLSIFGFDSGGEFVQVSACIDADVDSVQVRVFLGGVEVASKVIKSALQFGFTPPAGPGDYTIVFNDATGVGAGNSRFKSVSFLACKR